MLYSYAQFCFPEQVPTAPVSAARDHNEPKPRTFSGTDGFPESTDLSCLRGRNVLLIIDDDNIRISVERAGYRFSYRRTMDKIREVAESVDAWSFITPERGDLRRSDYLKARGVKIYTTYRETFHTRAGKVVKGNADNDILFEAPMLIQRGEYDTVCLGTGDADLGLALAKGIGRHFRDRRVVTLSVKSTTGRRLQSDRQTDVVASNIFIGKDLLRAVSGKESEPSLHNSRQRNWLLRRILQGASEREQERVG